MWTKLRYSGTSAQEPVNHSSNPLGEQILDGILSTGFLPPWDDDFISAGQLGDDDSGFRNHDLSILDLPAFPEIENVTDSGRNASGQGHLNDQSLSWPCASPAKRPRAEGLPVHLLTQHYSRTLAGRFSFKQTDWTFYTYFFHRFAASHPWVNSAILAWTSVNLFYTGNSASLDESLQLYDESLTMLRRNFGIHVHDLGAGTVPDILAPADDDDMDSIFVACFFLALFNLIAARPNHLRDLLRLIAQFLRNLDVRSGMTGVQSRVASWFCIMDGKASAFQRGEGLVLKAMGDQDSLISAVRSSFATLQQAYSVTYPKEERAKDEAQLPLLEMMLLLSSLLHQISEVKHCNPNEDDVSHIRATLDCHKHTINSVFSKCGYEGRNRSTFLVVSALYHSVEISFSRSLQPTDLRHAATQHAASIIHIAQKLKGVQPKELSLSPPPTKIWPLPLVMAAIEVSDIIYREWSIDMLSNYEANAGDHYSHARRFVEAVCRREDGENKRLDWEIIMQELMDGLVI
ncbi:hypothetical protein F1880_001851 [Penicillium rolfsii]|nr:hypothetical protein F1880_001851 [Penicillium rolfsii]